MSTQLTLSNLSNREIETQAQSSTRRHGFELEERLTPDFSLVGLKVKGDPSLDQLKAARSEIEEGMNPATDDELLAAFVKVSALTTSRNMSDDAQYLQMEAHIEKLKGYPRDAALKALETVVDESDWFPSWKKIKDLCQFYSQRRRMALSAIDVEINRRVMKKIGAA
jgi:DNA-binding NarL/FixJ family response regulator